ncbi:hypothetical protein UFOVP244_61 [uncultured Caudovirales phage]|uniref:Uncharacterized protein n=1 Tax=uncultured Caudovirales phage TaxID=2100421 RepID=A0A6J7WVX7_9CAUD|nr:hypothetical protein UFOVP244_61 [uncultured Caudovirales phage]
MIINYQTSENHKVAIYDCSGSEIPGVISFNTDTQETEMLIWLLQQAGANERPVLKTIGTNGEKTPFVAKIKIPGAYAILDGQKV